MKSFLVILSIFLSLACSHPAPPPALKHYSLSGKVVKVDASDHTAAIDAAAIPGFMEAMTMDYPIQSKDDFALLHPGDRISATIDAAPDGSYTLSHIKVLAAAPQK